MLSNRRTKNPNPPARTGKQSRATAVNFLLFQLQGARGNIAAMQGRLSEEYKKAVQRQASVEELLILFQASSVARNTAEELNYQLARIAHAMDDFKRRQTATKLRKLS